MNRNAVVLILLLFVGALAGCSYTSTEPNPTVQKGFEFRLTAPATAPTGSKVIIKGSIVEGFDPVTNINAADTLGYVDSRGEIIGNYERTVVGIDALYTCDFWLIYPDGVWHRLWDRPPEVNGVELTAIEQTAWVLRWKFWLRKGEDGEMYIDPGPDDRPRLRTVTIAYWGDPASPFYEPCNVSTPVYLQSVWSGNDALGTFAGNRWEWTEKYLLPEHGQLQTLYFRFTDHVRQLVGGNYGGNTLFFNLLRTGPDWLVMETRFDENGIFHNPCPDSDERAYGIHVNP